MILILPFNKHDLVSFGHKPAFAMYCWDTHSIHKQTSCESISPYFNFQASSSDSWVALVGEIEHRHKLMVSAVREAAGL